MKTTAFESVNSQFMKLLFQHLTVVFVGMTKINMLYFITHFYYQLYLL